MPENASQFRVAPSLVLKTRVHVPSLKVKSHFAFNTHFRKKSVRIKSLVEQGAIPLDIFGYYSLSTLPVFIFTLPTSFNISHCLLSNKYALYLSVNVFSTKVLIGDTIFTSPTGDGTAILRGHPSHAKV